MKCINCAYIMSCEKASKEIKECEKYIKRECQVEKKTREQKNQK